MQILFILSGDSLLNSGVSRVWQAWLVPWAPLWWERKYCLAKIKICDLQFLQPLYCAPYVNELTSYIDTAPLASAMIRVCCASTMHCGKTMVL